jgi:hypothetical protein
VTWGARLRVTLVLLITIHENGTVDTILFGSSDEARYPGAVSTK